MGSFTSILHLRTVVLSLSDGDVHFPFLHILCKLLPKLRLSMGLVSAGRLPHLLIVLLLPTHLLEVQLLPPPQLLGIWLT